MYRFAYLTGDLIIFCFWLFLFLKRKDLRHEMIFMGLLSCAWLIAAGAWFYNQYLVDYWRPQFAGVLHLERFFQPIGLHVGGIEDVFFWFCMSGIAAIIYEELYHKSHKKIKKNTHKDFFGIFPLIIFITYLLVSVFGKVNIIYGELLGYILGAFVVWSYRKDLVIHSLFSAVFMSVFFFLFYLLIIQNLFPGIIHSWWILRKTTGIFILGIPFEEILWAFSFGLFIAPMYEFLYNLKDR